MTQTGSDSPEPEPNQDAKQTAPDRLPTSQKHPQSDSGHLQDANPAAESGKQAKEKAPPGGYDDTRIPRASQGWTVKFTFHRATSLPMADIVSYSSDPYFTAQLDSDLPTRHKEDPVMLHRSKVIWKNTNPEWNDMWIVGNVPSTGFRLKVRVYDEDTRDRDDRLGNVHFNVDKIDEHFQNLINQPFKIEKRTISKRAFAFRAIAVCMSQAEDMSGKLWISVEVLGRTNDENGGRIYTIRPCPWSKHFSPLLGRMAGTRQNTAQSTEQFSLKHNRRDSRKQGHVRYSFEANQLQLEGPVPEEMYHRYVEFRPFVKSLYTKKGLRGIILSKMLHHQHTQVYNHDKATLYGVFPEPSKDMALKFLEMVHQDRGGRIFTYIITLDALWRFTETGKEFGIDMLSKHTMHSDVSTYIAYSGEFFVRRLHRRRHANHSFSSTQSHITVESRASQSSDRPQEDSVGNDPSRYQLIIDNDSGTYRPNAKLLPILKSFLERNLPGLNIRTLDCGADADEMDRLKTEQREIKHRNSGNMVFTQLERTGSVSSSDESRLEGIASGKSKEAKGGQNMTLQAGKVIKRGAMEKARPRKGLPKSISKEDDHDDGKLVAKNNT